MNVHTDKEKKMKWKSGPRYPKSVVITDFGMSASIRVSKYKRAAGTPGWAPPEQWLGRYTSSKHTKEYNSPEDAFSFGRLMIYMFSNWSFAWKLTFSPMQQFKR